MHVATPNPEKMSNIPVAGIKFHRIMMNRSGLNLFREIKSFLSIATLYKNVKPDLVHTVTIKPVIYGGLLARMMGVPDLVSAVPGLGYLYIKKGLKANIRVFLVNRLYKLALSHPNSRIIFQNMDDRQYFIRHKITMDERVRIIRGSGVDLKKYQQSQEPDGVPIVMLASRLLWDKGIDEFVQAANIVRQADVSCRFVLVGDLDPQNPSSIERTVIEAWVDSGYIEWWGKKNNMPEILSQANIVVLPSYREGLPKVLIEAAAAGRAIITTDVPGCRDVVIEGETGSLVPVRNGKLLAQEIIALLADRKKRARMGEAGRKMAEKYFSIDDVIDKTLSIYSELLELQ